MPGLTHLLSPWQLCEEYVRIFLVSSASRLANKHNIGLLHLAEINELDYFLILMRAMTLGRTLFSAFYHAENCVFCYGNDVPDHEI